MDFSATLLGGWAMQQPAAKDLEADDSAPEACWRLDLPADPDAAYSVLRAQRKAFQQDRDSIEHATQRLTRFVDEWEPGQAAQTKSLEANTPEDALAATLSNMQSSQEKGLLDPLQVAREEFDQFIRRVRELVANYALVETASHGQRVAQTAVGWTGDFKTLWCNEATIEHIRLHRHNVHVALARRLMLVRLVAVVSTGAAKIVIRLATPGAQLLVIPAIWQFVRDVVNEYRRMANEE